MSLADKIEDIKKLKKKAQVDLNVVQKQVVPEKTNADEERFKSLMAPDKNANQAAQSADNRPSMIDEARKAYANQPAKDAVAANDTKKLVAQIDTTVQNIQKAKQQLAQPDARVKTSTQFLLKNRLNEINENIKTAFKQAGIEGEYEAPQRMGGFTNPLQRFLGMLTNGQKQLESLGKRIQALSENDGPPNPAKMLMLQDRMNRIQQQIEFFTSLLNKGLESVKTIMNVQI